MMFYVPNEYSNYKYLVSASDNLIILSNSSGVDGSWEYPDTINVIYQYLTPSITTIPATYTTSQSYRFSNVSNQITDNIFCRADFPQIFICNFLCVLIFCFVLNGITRLVKRGGSLFGV